jgi:hypothetical protein
MMTDRARRRLRNEILIFVIVIAVSSAVAWAVAEALS